ncbi:MAG: G5 domain-containing protein [Actinomycetaceae bacterium]|nr:G5 domain-containing protein [Actinomycetaceae bacterium]
MGRHSQENSELRLAFDVQATEAIASPVAGSRVAARRAERLAQAAALRPVPTALTPEQPQDVQMGTLYTLPYSSTMEGVHKNGYHSHVSDSKKKRVSIAAVAAAASGFVALGGTVHSTIHGSEGYAALASAEKDGLSLDGLKRTVFLNVDGQEQSFTTTSNEVAEVLAEAGVTYDADDQISLALTDRVSDGQTIVVTRVETKTETKEEVDKFETKKEEDPSLPKGEEKVVTEGKDGKVRNSYAVTYEGGKEVLRSLVASTSIEARVDKVVKVGTGEKSSSSPSSSSSASSSTSSLPTVPAGSAQEIAHQMVLERGWGEDQFTCLVTLWNKESRWNYKAQNKSSGAYGIPQALPGSKMASAGADWRTNPATQIKWGLGYISGRYGTPCNALAHSKKTGWY